MNVQALIGLLILLVGLAMLVVSFSQLGHHVNEQETIPWFWYLIIGIGVLAAILGGTLLYQQNVRKATIQTIRSPARVIQEASY